MTIEDRIIFDNLENRLPSLEKIEQYHEEH